MKSGVKLKYLKALLADAVQHVKTCAVSNVVRLWDKEENFWSKSNMPLVMWNTNHTTCTCKCWHVWWYMYLSVLYCLLVKSVYFVYIVHPTRSARAKGLCVSSVWIQVISYTPLRSTKSARVQVCPVFPVYIHVVHTYMYMHALVIECDLEIVVQL